MKRLLSSTILASSLLAAPSAFAQEKESIFSIEEIVVTAQKRTENIQDVPIAVSAFSAEALANSGISEVSQLANLSPNVTLDAGTPFSGSSSVLAAYIRGIGQNDFAFNLDPGVGIYVDGVYLARTVGANASLLDVERIEILKGPQGTLFGRNSIGGAVSIVTREPGNEFSFRGEVTTGSFERFDVAGAADIPLIQDKLAATVAFSSVNREGFQKRIPFPGAGAYVTDSFDQFKAAGYRTSDTEGGQNEWSIRGKVVYNASDDLKITLGGDYSKADQSAMASTLIKTHSGPDDVFAHFYNACLDGAFVPTVCGGHGTSVDTTYSTPSIFGVNVDADPDNDRLYYDDQFVLDDPDLSYANGNSLDQLETYGGALTIDYALNDSMDLKSITAYRELHWTAAMDLDGSPLPMLHTSFTMNQKQFSQELQLLGSAMDDKLDYVFGAFYFEESGDLHDHVTFPSGLLQVDGPNDLWTDSWAVFTHLNYALTDKLGLTLGARYTEENKSFEGFQSDYNGLNYKFAGLEPNAENAVILGFPNPDEPLRYYPAGVRDKKFTNFSPRVGLEFHPNEDMMVYASWSKGYKTGSWTTRLSNPPVAADRLDFDEEKATSYEIGLKSEFMDRRAQVNISTFYSEYNGIQLNFQEGVSPTIRNAGDAEIKGFEAEFQFVVTDGFLLRGGIGYTDAKYTYIDPRVAGISTESVLPKTPEWMINISPSYELSLANGGSLLFNVDYTHTTSLYNDTENTELLKRPAVDNLNASITYREPNEHWDLVFGGTNILDERYLITGQAQLAGGQTYGTYNRPAEWYAKLRVNF
ncbi:TonB-dependent receptor [Emcibacter sp.]|uniref:TonB-dependent receptor n=1 Tax=Emcibacter sp. TaxID=1979954 RepID=UPI002AA7AF1B|nr:TonB-dependent receptor [Emcibacter sp.]